MRFDLAANLRHTRISPMRTVWTFNSAIQIMFGRDAVKQLGDIATRLRAKKALIVTDPILEKAGLLERTRQPLVAAGLNVTAFTRGQPEPAMKAALASYEIAISLQPAAPC